MMFYTYIFLRPTGEPYYVGYSRNLSRLQRLGRNELCNRITRSILRSGNEPGIEILSSPTKEAALDKEIELIALHGRISDGTGILANHTGGGEGLQEYQFTDLHCQRISEAKSGVRFTEEHKKQLSIAASKRKASDETRRKMSLSQTGKIMPPGHGHRVWETRRAREQERRNMFTEQQRNTEDKAQIERRLAADERNRASRKRGRERRRLERLENKNND